MERSGGGGLHVSLERGCSRGGKVCEGFTLSNSSEQAVCVFVFGVIVVVCVCMFQPTTKRLEIY